MKTLRDKTGYSNIYIKKDVHPTIRVEQNRLRIKLREQKDLAENRGIEIKYDFKTRLMTRNGVVIDRFNPHFQ